MNDNSIGKFARKKKNKSIIYVSGKIFQQN